MNLSFNKYCLYTLISVWSGLLIAPASLAHNIHSSLTNIEWNSDDNSLEVILSLHGHELEARLSYEIGQKLSFLNPTDQPKLEAILTSYLQDHIMLETGNSVILLDYIGMEVQGQTVYVYLEKPLPTPPDTLSVSNTLLLDVFHDQVNTIIAKVGTERQSGDTFRSNESVTFKFNAQ